MCFDILLFTRLIILILKLILLNNEKDFKELIKNWQTDNYLKNC